MPYSTPKLIVDFIRQEFPELRDDRAWEYPLTPKYVALLRAVIRLHAGVPPELMPSDVQQNAALAIAVEAVQTAVESQMRRDWRERTATTERLQSIGSSQVSPLCTIRDVLETCPEIQPVTEERLLFLPEETRQGILIDLREAEQSIKNTQWKSATVLSGATMEALLIWALEKRDPCEVLRVEYSDAGEKKGRTPSSLESFTLAQAIQVALQLGIITEPTVRSAHVAKDFRNLIHPGRALRMNKECSPGTAFQAFASLLLVIEDLERALGSQSPRAA